MIRTLFGLPFFKSNIDENNFPKSDIVNTIQENYKKNIVRNSFNFSNLHHLYGDLDNPDFKNISFCSLKDVYANEINKFFNLFNFNKSYRFTYEVVNYTAMNKAGQYFNNHSHHDCHFSAVHYLKFNKNFHKPTLYKNPYNAGSHLCFLYKNFVNLYDGETNETNMWTATDFMLNIEENDFVITPAFLEHSVPSQIRDCEDIRITLVLNIKLL